VLCKPEASWWQILGHKDLRGTYVTRWGLSEHYHRLCTAVAFLRGEAVEKRNISLRTQKHFSVENVTESEKHFLDLLDMVFLIS